MAFHISVAQRNWLVKGKVNAAARTDSALVASFARGTLSTFRTTGVGDFLQGERLRSRECRRGTWQASGGRHTWAPLLPACMQFSSGGVPGEGGSLAGSLSGAQNGC